MSLDKLPEEWRQASILTSITHTGLISDGDWVESKDQDPNGSVRLIQLADIGDGYFKNKSERFMTPEKVRSLNCTYLIPGDVLVARMPEPLGRACIFPDIGKNAVTVVDICLLRTSTCSAINNNILVHWLNSPAIRSIIEQNSSGSTRKRITRKKLEQFIIPLPPLAEQKIIAEKLDTLLAQVDSTKARLEQIPQILKRFRQAVLASAVSGKFTAEWRTSNNSKIIGEEIENTKNKLIEKKVVKKDLIYTALERTYTIPPSWLYIKLQSIATKITDGEHKTPKREIMGQLLLSARNIQDGYIKLSDVDYVGDAEFQKLRNRCDPDIGDVLISCSGSIGRVCLVDENSKYVMVRSVALVKLMQDFVINKYMMYLLQSPLLQKEIEENSKSTAQANLFLGPIKNLGIPLPSLPEQTEIVRCVEQLFAYADTIEKQVNNALAHVNSLTQSILAKAFRGELTAQWRAENPDLISGENSAAALLEKIKAERAASGSKKVSRKKK